MRTESMTMGNGTSTVRPYLRRSRRRRFRASLESMESRRLLTTFWVRTTTDGENVEGSLRDAIEKANLHPGADTIAFNIPAAVPRTNLTEAVPGFDINTQTWRITPNTALPAI